MFLLAFSPHLPETPSSSCEKPAPVLSSVFTCETLTTCEVVQSCQPVGHKFTHQSSVFVYRCSAKLPRSAPLCWLSPRGWVLHLILQAPLSLHLPGEPPHLSCPWPCSHMQGYPLWCPLGFLKCVESCTAITEPHRTIS